MSRCYPFPPPGYEKKSGTHLEDLLRKEKDWEKKHKKENDREKREGKEKRESGGSDGKHRDKKDRKEKHRDKKGHKDKSRDKSSASNEKRLPGQSERNNGEEASNKRKLPAKLEVSSGEIFAQQRKERDRKRNSITVEKKFVGQFSGYSGEKLSQNSHLVEHPKDSKFVLELGRRVNDDDRGTPNQLVDKFAGVNEKRDEGMIKSVAKAIGTCVEGKEKNKRGDDRKLDGQGVGNEVRFTENSLSQSLFAVVQTRIDGNTRPVEKLIENKIEGKEKTKQKEGDGKSGNKHKGKKKEKKGQGKDKDRDKEKKAKENKNTELDKLANKDDLTCAHDVKASHLSKESTNSVVREGNLRKRKESESNGFLHVAANEIKPSKLPKPTSSSHPLPENGRIRKTCQPSGRETCQPSAIPFTSGMQGAVNNLKMGNKEHKINGIVEAETLRVSSTARPLLISSMNTSVTTAKIDQLAEVSRKPHSDSKYLREVLTVPKIEGWSSFDEQEWLFQSSNSNVMKPKVGSSGFDETQHVWSETLQIESADVCALPYVVPY